MFSEDEKIYFYDNQLSEIFTSNENALIDFIKEYIEDDKIRESLKGWPDEIKIKIVDKFLEGKIDNDSNDEDVKSWEEYYEMYDGKFDEYNMIHITIYKQYRSELEDLDYEMQEIDENWHKPGSGEFKLNEHGDLVIIHSCPDREIFKFGVDQLLEDLWIKQEWVREAALTAM